MKPYYEDEWATIYHGDCRDILPALPLEDVALVTDPPYGVNAEAKPHGRPSSLRATWDDRVPYEMRSQFDGLPIVWFGAAPKIGEAFTTFDRPPDRMLVWAPRFTLSMVAKGGIAYRYHPIYVWDLPVVKPTVHDVFTDPTECGNWWYHQATKPERLMGRLVSLTGSGLVVDPFMGSGSTLRAAKTLGRKAIGIEVEERYCEIAVRRMAQEVLDLDGVAQ